MPAGPGAFSKGVAINPTLSPSDVEDSVFERLNPWSFSSLPPIDLCERVEEQVLIAIPGLIQNRVRFTAELRDQEFHPISPQQFRLGESFFEVRLGEDPVHAGTLHVGLAALGGETKRLPQPLEVEIDGRGRYSTALLHIDPDFSQTATLLAQDLKAHLEAGYRWLEAHVIGNLLQREQGATLELYMELRSVLPPDLVDLVGLYGMSGGKAFYLLDPKAIQTALARASANRANIAASPVELTTMLATQLLDPVETVAQASVAENRPLELGLDKSRYSATGLNLAEGAFYETIQVVSFPLVREGRIQLTAVFPADLQQQIEPRLHLLPGLYSEIFRRSGKSALRRLSGPEGPRPATGARGEVAELMGRFTGGCVDSLS